MSIENRMRWSAETCTKIWSSYLYDLLYWFIVVCCGASQSRSGCPTTNFNVRLLRKSRQSELAKILRPVLNLQNHWIYLLLPSIWKWIGVQNELQLLKSFLKQNFSKFNWQNTSIPLNFFFPTYKEGNKEVIKFKLDHKHKCRFWIF